jgi:hypothetical protein
MRTFTQFARSFRKMMFRGAGRSLDTCLILPKTKIVYAYIPKSACTSIKTWLLRHSGECADVAAQFDVAERTGAKPPDAHDTMSARFLAKRWPAQVVREAVHGSAYFKFTFVRHPLRRLLSAYLDKVVNAKATAHELIVAWQAANGCSPIRSAGWFKQPAIDAERSLSFREFVQALQAADPETVDVHFRSQDRLLRGLEFDYVGKIEDLPQAYSEVQQRLRIPAPLSWKHVREYSVAVEECVADWPAARFRNVAVPGWQAFFDESLRQACCELYAADFQRFGYSTELTTPENANHRAA